MKHKGMLYLSFVVVACLVVLWGCPKKGQVSTAQETPSETAAEDAARAAEAQRAADAAAAAARAAEEARLARLADEANAREQAASAASGLKPIYFDFDKSHIRSDATDIMKSNAAWLKAHPRVKVRIEGNCDERGAKEYNQALGQRRSAMAKKYLTDMGISAQRIVLLSYGKEKPICNEHDEACWQKNRRDDFVVVGE
jgi:peptidoglycan-associated lipoprotein